jgi:hypothetical protein
LVPARDIEVIAPYMLSARSTRNARPSAP